MAKRKALNEESINTILDQEIEQNKQTMDGLLAQVVDRNTVNDIIYRASIEHTMLLKIKLIFKLKMEEIINE